MIIESRDPNQGRTKWRNCKLTIQNPDYQGAVHKLSHLKGGVGGQKLPILLSKKTTKRGKGGGSKIADFETT